MNAIKSVASYARNTRARALFHINSGCGLKLVHNFAKSSPSCGAGIGLPVDTAAQSRIRKSAAFSILVPFMAVQARRLRPRQLPLRGVTGRPTRLDCRPDWSRVGSHFSNDTSEAIMAKSLASPGITRATAPEILIQIIPGAYTDFVGTPDQLRAEGLIPEGFEWPTRGLECVSFEMGRFTCFIGRSIPANRKAPKGFYGKHNLWFLRRGLTENAGDGFMSALLCTLTIGRAKTEIGGAE